MCVHQKTYSSMCPFDMHLPSGMECFSGGGKTWRPENRSMLGDSEEADVTGAQKGQTRKEHKNRSPITLNARLRNCSFIPKASGSVGQI